MNGKRAKELRRAAAVNAPAIEVRITVAQDGKVDVFGFPNNFNQAMDIMKAGIHALSAYFVRMARDGKVDEKLNLEQSRIVKPDGALPMNPRLQ